MTLADDVTLDDLILAKDDLSGADIKVLHAFLVSLIGWSPPCSIQCSFDCARFLSVYYIRSMRLTDSALLPSCGILQKDTEHIFSVHENIDHHNSFKLYCFKKPLKYNVNTVSVTVADQFHSITFSPCLVYMHTVHVHPVRSLIRTKTCP